MGRFAADMRALMQERGISGNELARLVPCDPALISRYATSRQHPSAKMAARIDQVLQAGGTLAEAAQVPPARQAGTAADDGEIEAIELARRCTVSDAGEAAVSRLELAADDLAIAYASGAPAELLHRARSYLAYASVLLAGRMTLGEHRRTLVSMAWLTLLSATNLTDLHRYAEALAFLRTAAQIAQEAGHAEISAWSLETRAWVAVSDADYTRAASLARSAQELAPRGSSALIQATAQEGRAWARLGAGRETYDALSRVEALVSPLPVPDQPEHHYRYDPQKAEAYTATTLAWVGDPAAEGIARSVLARMESPADGHPRPRRAVAARIDLALALAKSGKPDEAAAITIEAVTSPYLVPSNYWRAAEVLDVIPADVPGRADLADAYREMCQPASPRELT